MENKKVLGKIIPAVLVLVLALLLVIIISSCSKGKKTPTGEIVDEKNYLKIDLANNKSYSVSKLEFYDKLRYVGYDVFEDALFEAALSDIVSDIKADVETNGNNPESCKYYKKFKYIIDKAVYEKTDEDEIEDIDEKDRVIKEKTYLNALKQKGYEIDYAKGIYQKASLESMITTLAKREYARGILLDEIDDDDSENQITFKIIEKYFEDNALDKDDLSALLILCSSQTEINDTLKQLNLKFAGNKLYRVLPNDDIYEDPANPKFSEYEKYYDDYDTSVSGVSALDDNEVLFELCRLYNYVYSYKAQLTYTINGEDYLAKYALDTLHRTYTDADYTEIHNFALDDAIKMVLDQDTGESDAPRLNYNKKILSKIDTSLQTSLNRSYLVNSKEHSIYNTPSSTYSRGNYLTFKLKDGFIFDYRGIEALANLQNGVANNESESVIKGHIESVREEFTDIINGYGFKTDEEVKTWALEYASKITVFGITGAKEIVASTKDKENQDSIFSRIFETLLTDEYIEEKINEFLKDNCKISIYDNLFEVQFAQKYDFYKTSNKSSKTDVLKVKVTNKDTKEKKETTIKATEMFDRLYKRYGAIEATFTLGSQILKDLYYKDLFLDEKGKTNDKYKEYQEQYDQILTFFASGNSAQYGYSPAIGQKAFVNLYFRADNKDDAIFNMWVAAELQNTLIYQHPDAIRTDMISVFDTLTNVNVDNYAHIEYNLLYVYTDDDEDGKADDWTIVDDTDPVKYARKQEVMELAAKLINLINERAAKEYSNSNRSSAYNNYISDYKSASRISQLGNYADGDPEPTFETDTEKEAYYFAKFKEKGLMLQEDASVAIDGSQAVTDLDDDAYETQVKEMYKYILRNYKDALDDDLTIARKVEADDEGFNIDKVATSTLFEYEKGYGTFFVVKTTEAPNFKFEEKDNSDTSTGSKVYPYSINEDDPFPLKDGKPYDNTGEEDSLYNTEEKVSKNQIIVYVREYKDGVESLSLSVVDSFKAYFENQAMTNYVSENFRYYILKLMIDKYKAEGKLTISDELMNSINTFVEAENESLFGFKTSETSTAWYNIFK